MSHVSLLPFDVLDIFITNCRIGQLLHHAENGLQQKLAYQQQLDSMADEFDQLFKAEGRMELLFDHLNECAVKLAKRMYSCKQLTMSGSPRLKWDWSQVRFRGSSGNTGVYSKSYGVTQNEFQNEF